MSNHSVHSSWSPFFKVYDPLRAGSIDGTDTIPHDNAVIRAMCAEYTPPNKRVSTTEPQHTLFIGRLNFRTTDKQLEKEFSQYGSIRSSRLVRNIVTGSSCGYAFVEFKRREDAERAWRKAHGTLLHDRQLLVEWEFARTMAGWIPRRLGGGLGGKKESGQLRFGGRDRPFRRPFLLSQDSKGETLPSPEVYHHQDRTEEKDRYNNSAETYKWKKFNSDPGVRGEKINELDHFKSEKSKQKHRQGDEFEENTSLQRVRADYRSHGKDHYKYSSRGDRGYQNSKRTHAQEENDGSHQRTSEYYLNSASKLQSKKYHGESRSHYYGEKNPQYGYKSRYESDEPNCSFKRSSTDSKCYDSDFTCFIEGKYRFNKESHGAIQKVEGDKLLKKHRNPSYTESQSDHTEIKDSLTLPPLKSKKRHNEPENKSSPSDSADESRGYKKRKKSKKHKTKHKKTKKKKKKHSECESSD